MGEAASADRASSRGRFGSSLFDLRGRRALVTGSTRGIGASIARGLAEAGATVVVHGRRSDDAEAVKARLAESLTDREVAARVLSVGFDVCDADAMAAAMQTIEDRIGGVDILVNNAGIQYRSPLVDFPRSAWEEVLATNMTSAFLLAQRVAPRMIARRSGKIINVCSVQTKLVRATTSAYAAAKGALGTLGQAMCAEWAEYGIQVNGLAPGYIDTDMNAALVNDPKFTEWVVSRTPARRWGSPDDLIGPAVWLASPASDFVNGQVIYVDGGMTAVA